jgi:hypothetical protein
MSDGKRKYGFNMSLLGMVMNGLGGIVVYVVVIVLTQTLSGEAAQSSYVKSPFCYSCAHSSSRGLLVSTIIGFITVAGSAAAFLGLPVIPSRPLSLLRGSPLKPVIECKCGYVSLFTDLMN